jgi:hypothetical protein
MRLSSVRRIGAIGAPLAGVVCVACAGGGPDAGAVVVRDSAGIRIVESTRPLWPDGAGWRIESEPLVSIGVAEGDTLQQLFRVADVLMRSDGGIVIANAGSSQLRWYDAEGNFVRAAGRTGEGPGEFSRFGPNTLCELPGDRLLAGDPMLQRANVFAMDGTFAEVVRPGVQDAAFPSIQGCFADGTMQAWRAVSPPDRIPGTLIGSEFVWTRLAADGEVVNELARMPGGVQYLLGNADGSATYHTVPFTVRPSGVAGSDRFYVTTGGSPVIEQRRLDGSLESIWRWAPVQRLRSSDVLDRYRSHMIEAQRRPEQRAQWARFFQQSVDIPEFVASTTSLLVDAASHVWAERYRLPWDSSAIWDVFDETGAWLGGVAVPQGLGLYQIDRDAVLGRRVDDDGVERVLVYRLHREPGGGA